MKQPVVQSLFLLFGLLASVAAAQDAQDRDWQRDREQTQQQVENLPKLSPANLADVLQFKLGQGDLFVLSRQGMTDGASQIKLNDLPGLYSLKIGNGDRGDGPRGQVSVQYTPRFFTFIRYDFKRLNDVESITTVMVTPLNMQIARDTESRSETQNVSIVQPDRAHRSGEPGVTLRVSIQNNLSDQLSTRIDRSAADFLTLRRLYPAETAKYLEPIFQDLRADADVFGVDSKLAWQVLAADAIPDPKVTAAVQQIVVRLDSDDFHDRESAARELAQLGQPAAIALLHFDRSGLSAEQNSRLDAFLSPYHPAADEEARRLGQDVSFLIDCLYDTDDFIVTTSLKHLRQITGRPVAFDPSLRDDARRQAIARLRDLVAAPTSQPQAQ